MFWFRVSGFQVFGGVGEGGGEGGLGRGWFGRGEGGFGGFGGFGERRGFGEGGSGFGVSKVLGKGFRFSGCRGQVCRSGLGFK